MSEKAPPIIPECAQIIGAAKARLAQELPEAAPKIETGTFRVPFTGWRAQLTVVRARLAAEVRAAFPKTATGDELSELMASDYDTPRATTGPVAAVGNVLLARRVVHHLPSASLLVTAADATDASTLSTLLTNIQVVFNAHAASVYSSGTGTGAHAVAETDVLSAPVTATMGDIVAVTSLYVSSINAHFARAASLVQIALGLAAKPHATADSASTIDVDDAFASDPPAAFAAQTLASQQSALLVANAIKTALNTHFGLRAIAGTIRQGTRFRVEANPAAVPPIEGAEYEVVQNEYVRTGAQSVSPSVRAVVPGPGANHPAFLPSRSSSVKALGTLYDAAETLRFAPTLLTAAGGTNGQPDELLRRAGLANWRGSYGPTTSALVAGALRFPGLAVCPILRDPETGTSILYPLDESWAQSATWTSALQQHLNDDWRGVGCRISTGAVVNRLVRIELSVVLRERRYLADATEITTALSAALRDYFDSRPDFWIFRLAGLRAVCTRAHRKIQSCVAATVLDASGAPIDEPAQPEPGDPLVHWWFADGAVEVAYDAPS